MHCHIVANRVGFNGKAVSDYFCKSKAVSETKKLEDEYQLPKVQDIAKRRNKIKEKLNQLDPNKQLLANLIDSTLKQPGIKSFPDLASELLKNGIDMQVLKHAKTGIEYGITFKMTDKVFKGSDLGKKYAFKSISNQINTSTKFVVKTFSRGRNLEL
jgi:hypothetical protein